MARSTDADSGSSSRRPRLIADPTVIARIEGLFEEALSLAAPAANADLVDTGLLDSLALVTLLFEIEQEFLVQIPLDTLEIEDFRTIDRIAELITSDRVEHPG